MGNKNNVRVYENTQGVCVDVSCDPQDVRYLAHHTLANHKHVFKAPGFSQENVPLSYLQRRYRGFISNHLREFLCAYYIINRLYHTLIEHGLVVAHDPHLEKAVIDEHEKSTFCFMLPSFSLKPPRTSWRSMKLKKPKRKNYKDIDRQADSFLEHETRNKENAEEQPPIKAGDWIQFHVALVDTDSKPITSLPGPKLWLRLGYAETDKDAHALFYKARCGVSFLTQNHFIQQHFSGHLDTSYTYRVTITDHLPHAYFDLDLLRHHFGIDDMATLRKKLIEVFSFRNDISQRREIIEALFHQLHKYYPTHLPQELIDRERAHVLDEVRSNPDYFVYKAQKHFEEDTFLLAEKQLKEKIVIDHLAHQEGITVDDNDVRAYLNLYLRPRAKEFVYFCLPQTQHNGQEHALPDGLVRHACRREKTLNHIINTLESFNPS